MNNADKLKIKPEVVDLEFSCFASREDRMNVNISACGVAITCIGKTAQTTICLDVNDSVILAKALLQQLEGSEDE